MDGTAIIVGGGIIGLNSAYYLNRAGYNVTVVDRDLNSDKASWGNAGGIGVSEIFPQSVPRLLWKIPRLLFDPLGPLSLSPTHLPAMAPWLLRFMRHGTNAELDRLSNALVALHDYALSDLEQVLEATGLSMHMHRLGSFSVYRSVQAYKDDIRSLPMRRAKGVECHELSGDELRRHEPSLNASVQCGLFFPKRTHVSDPKLICDGIQRWLEANGVVFMKGEVAGISRSQEQTMLHLHGGAMLASENIVICAGAQSKRLAIMLGDRVLLEGERGYNVTFPKALGCINRVIGFPEHKIVASPLSCGLRIGGAAEFGALSRRPNLRRAGAYGSILSKYVNDVPSEGEVHWHGDRPSTPDSLPVIGRSPKSSHVTYAFGHGHLGLTQSAITGRLVEALVSHRTPPLDVTPYSIKRFS